MRILAASLAALAVAACSPPVPDSGSGVGFEDYSDYSTYRATREAELAGGTPQTVRPPTRTTVATAADGRVQASPSNPAPELVTTETLPASGASQSQIALNNPGISDEQSFDAVAGRELIESDRERLQAQREAYQVIQPTAVPSRSGASGPNIVAFALSTTNRVGQKVYRRTALVSGNRYIRNCGKYATADLAQEAFLDAGGPERDRLGLDPDGDGFACTWDPSPFRRVSAARG